MSKLFDGNTESTSRVNDKKEYVQNWIEYNLCFNTNLPSDDEASLRLAQTNVKHDEAIPISPAQQLDHKHLPSCSYQRSPILGGKRSRSTKSQSLKRNTKALKVRKLCVTENKGKDPVRHKEGPKIGQRKLEPHYKQSLGEDNFLKCKNDIANIKSTISIHKSNGCKTFSNISTIVEEVISQFTESTISDKEDTEINIQEVHTDSDKTESDLIENISSQALEFDFEREENPKSQAISNSSSAPLKSLANIRDSESVVIESIESRQVESYTPSDPINTASSSETKVDFNKPSYILQNVFEENKKKRVHKKGSLLENLYKNINKEKSTINLLRHQLSKKSFDNVTKPFVLLQIVEYLPAINENQLVKCLLVDDQEHLLSDLLKKSNDRLITIMNAPLVSGTINTKQKPMLKVYEPWTILDPDQLFVHITRFTAIPNTQEAPIRNDNTKNSIVIKEFQCPCIEEKMLSDKCKSKFQDDLYNIVKEIFDYT